MRIKILLLALLPAYPVMAQEAHFHDEDHAPQVRNLFKEDILQLEKSSFIPTTAAPEMHTSAETEIAGLKEGFDYFAPEWYLRPETAKAAEAHRFSLKQAARTAIVLDDVHYSDLECTFIEDEYSLYFKDYPDAYKYHNTTFLYKDKEGREVATVIYIERNVDGLITRQKVVRKGIAAIRENNLSVAPNPAGAAFTLTCDIAAPGVYDIFIKDATGRTVYTVKEGDKLETGNYKLAVSPDLPAGFYFVTLQSGNKSLSRKLIIK